MRTTLATNLARKGVAPQVAQRILRHRDYRTTLKHYTALELEDSAEGLLRVRPLPTPEGGSSRPGSGGGGPQICPQSRHETAHFHAARRDVASNGGAPGGQSPDSLNPEF